MYCPELESLLSPPFLSAGTVTLSVPLPLQLGLPPPMMPLMRHALLSKMPLMRLSPPPKMPVLTCSSLS